MSEKLQNHEALPAPKHESHPIHHKKHEKAPAHKHNAHEQAHKARETIAHTPNQVNPIEKLKADENAPQPVQPTRVNRELRQITLRRELQHIRRKLPAPQRTLSKVIHQPVVRVASEAAGNTVSRPSGLLGGGLVALVGTTLYLVLANHVGFQYNYGVFLVLFVVGFALGLLIELGVYAITGPRRRAND